jgi:hypothetical protein
MWSTGSDPSWSDDLAVVRDLGLVPIGSEGVLSSVLSQLMALLPVGGRLLRASLLGVIALSVCSRLLFGQLRAVLDRHAPFGANPFLALLGSQLWALHPSVSSDAGHVGGPAVALLVVLTGARIMGKRTDARAFALTGALIALAAAENHAAGAILLLASGVRSVVGARRAEPGMWMVASGAASLGALLCAAGRGLRPLSPHAAIDLGLGMPTGIDLTEGHASSDGMLALAQSLAEQWLARLGAVPLALAVVGAVWAVCRGARMRRDVAVWGSFVAASGLIPVAEWADKPTWVSLLGLVSSLGVVAFVALALRAGAGWLWSCRLPFAKPASVLGVTFAITIVLSRIDDATRGDARPALGAEVWTEEALGNLPPRSVLLVQNPDLWFRLMAARVVRGDRPDVVIVPTTLLGSRPFTERLLSLEPELSPLLRQLTIHGLADEYSLCRLADSRPLFVELDRRWERRLLGHLRPEAMWLGFSPHALGVSDRHEGMRRSRAALRRALKPLEKHRGMDPMTRRVLADLASQQAVVLASLGDRDDARHLLRVVRRLEPADPLVMGLDRGPVDIDDLTD